MLPQICEQSFCGNNIAIRTENYFHKSTKKCFCENTVNPFKQCTTQTVIYVVLSPCAASHRRRRPHPWPKPGIQTLLWTRLQRVKLKMNLSQLTTNESVWTALSWDKRDVQSDALPMMNSLVWPLGM